MRDLWDRTAVEGRRRFLGQEGLGSSGKVGLQVATTAADGGYHAGGYRPDWVGWASGCQNGDCEAAEAGRVVGRDAEEDTA